MTDASPDGTLHLERTVRVPDDREPPRAGSDGRRIGAWSRTGSRTRSRCPPSTTPRRGRRASPRWTTRSSPASRPVPPTCPRPSRPREIDGVDVFVITPDGADAGDDAPVLLDIHGGALIAGGGEACRLMATSAATRAGLHTWSVDYRMPPDHPYPAPARRLRRGLPRAARRSARPNRSWSAAARPAATSSPRCCSGPRDEGLPMPAALVLLHARDRPHRVGRHVRHERGRRLRARRAGSPSRSRCTRATTTSPTRTSHRSSATSPASRPTFLQAGHARPVPLEHGAHAPQAARPPASTPSSTCGRRCPTAGSSAPPKTPRSALEVRRFLAKHLQR